MRELELEGAGQMCSIQVYAVFVKLSRCIFTEYIFPFFSSRTVVIFFLHTTFWACWYYDMFKCRQRFSREPKMISEKIYSLWRLQKVVWCIIKFLCLHFYFIYSQTEVTFSIYAFVLLNSNNVGSTTVNIYNSLFSPSDRTLNLSLMKWDHWSLDYLRALPVFITSFND